MVGALEQGWVDDLATLVRRGQDLGVFGTADPDSVALRARLLMDGVASDIVLGLPGRNADWGIRLVTQALGVELGVRSGCGARSG